VPVRVSFARRRRVQISIVKVDTVERRYICAPVGNGRARKHAHSPSEVRRLGLTFVFEEMRDAIGIRLDQKRLHWRRRARRRTRPVFVQDTHTMPIRIVDARFHRRQIGVVKVRIV
jgi:hypothetical protein